MNFQKLRDDFKIRFNSKDDVPCFFAGTPFFLLGDITASCQGHSLMTALSSGTALAINVNNGTNVFSIQTSRNNTSYSCEKHRLCEYHEENFSKNLFNLIGAIIPQIKEENIGFDMLFSDNTIDNMFHSRPEALLSAVALLFLPEKTPAQIVSGLSLPDLSKRELLRLLAGLAAKKDELIITDNSSFSYTGYHIPLDNKKIIIIKTDIKNQHIREKMFKVWHSFQNKNTNLDMLASFSKDMSDDDFSLTEDEINFLCFISNEEKRIEKCSNTSSFNEFLNIINQSGDEFISLCKNSDLDLFYNIARKIPETLAVRPAENTSCLYVIVNDEDVDNFTNTFEADYEKKAGYKPTFFICNTTNSGIERGIIR